MPNNSQIGVAIAAALMFGAHKRQCWRVPPGMGKSRIIAALAVIMHKKYKKKGLGKICIAFSSKILLDTDEQVYTILSAILGLKVHLSIDFDDVVKNMDKNDLLILDEADWHLLDQL